MTKTKKILELNGYRYRIADPMKCEEPILFHEDVGYVADIALDETLNVEDAPLTRSFEIENLPPEIAAIKIILEMLADFTPQEQGRILNYASSWCDDKWRGKK